jgi:hypothetical protein
MSEVGETVFGTCIGLDIESTPSTNTHKKMNPKQRVTASHDTSNEDHHSVHAAIYPRSGTDSDSFESSRVRDPTTLKWYVYEWLALMEPFAFTL